MPTCALLTLSGRDRPGIVARATRVLYETGCNIADSSMTRLRGEFVIMLILRLPDGLAPGTLEERLAGVAQELELDVRVKPLTPAEDTCPAEVGEPCVITVLGADQPGIVYRVSRALEEAGGNVGDLHTQVIGTPERPVYVMMIEAEVNGELAALQGRLAGLARELGVEITARADDVVEM